MPMSNIRAPGRSVLVALALFLAAAAGIGAALFAFRPLLIGAVIPLATTLGNEENLYLRYFTGRGERVGLRPIRLLMRNPEPEEAAVRAAARELAELGVVALVGGVLSADGAWLADEAAGLGLPVIGLTASSSALDGRKDGFFRLCPSNTSQARIVAEYFASRGSRRLGLVVSPENPVYAEAFALELEKALLGRVSRFDFESGEEAARTLTEVGADAAFAVLPAKDLIRLVAATRAADPSILLASSSWGSVEALSLYSGPVLDGVKFFTYASNLEAGPAEIRAEIEEFERVHSLKATNGSWYAASVLRLLRGALEEAGAGREALLAYLATPRSYRTAYGEVRMNEYGDSSVDRLIILETKQGVAGETLVLRRE